MKTTAATTPIVHESIEALQRLSEVFLRRREQLARDAGLTVQQWAVLEQISGEHFMPSMFAEERESSRAAVSKILRQLQDKGLVAVSVSPSNGRHREYQLTEDGLRAMDALRGERERAIHAVWSEIDEKHLEWFVYFSKGLIQRLENYATEEESRKNG